MIKYFRKSTCQTGLYALRWTRELVEGSLKNQEDTLDYNILVLTQANLLAVVTAYGNKKKNDKGYTVVNILRKYFLFFFNTQCLEFAQKVE